MDTAKTVIIKKSLSFSIIISKEVEEKIRAACNKLPTSEWSGVLFYDVKNKFGNKNFSITCVDFLIMDVGTQTYTEFEMSPEVPAYIAENIELADCYIGLIHSHDTMDTFFSGTDINTLCKEGVSMNHFVSLIVNNAGSYSAAITSKEISTETIHEEIECPSFNNEVSKFEHDRTIQKEELVYYPLNIVYSDTSDITKQVVNRIDEILKEKSKKAAAKAKVKVINQDSPSLFDYAASNIYHSTASKTDLFHDIEPIELPIMNTPISSPEIDKLLINFRNQILTSSTIIPENGNFDVDNWASKIDVLYDKRFNNVEEYNKFASSFIDTIINEAGDVLLKDLGFKEDAFGDSVSYAAQYIIDTLKELKQSKYIEAMIHILEDYLV